MSADLLAAFGRSSVPEQAAHSATGLSHAQTIQQSLFEPAANGNDVLFDADELAADDDADDDDFGDFEHVKPDESRPSGTIHQDSRHEAPLIDLLSLDDEAPQSSAPAPDIVPASWTTATAPTPVDEAHSGPLADAAPSGPLADDGWGDFADVEQPAAQSEDLKAGLPLSIEEPAVQKVKHSKPLRPRQEPPAAKSIPEPEPEPEPDEAWDDFEDMPPASTHPLPGASTSTSLPQARPSPSKPAPVRPTNVPPPSLLLSFLPTTFLSLLRPEHAPADILGTFRVASRVMAGRSLRWKRDTLLAQSTRIAAAGRPGGMKLASVNKGESLAEERECAEVVEVWNSNLVKFQAALAKDKTALGAGAGRAGSRLATNMAVKTATGPAILEARVVCALCGLKRSERIAGVDDRAEDVFGEFWLETWGHRECCEWWEQWKGQLRQR